MVAAGVFDARFRHGKALVNGVMLHYVVGGQGDPVVLLHGWPGTWYHWRKLMPLLADRYTVVAPDLRGFGESSKPDSGYDTRAIAADVHELVGALGLPPAVHLVGHDMGAVHAYTYAANYRDEARTLTYIDEPLPGFGYERFATAFSAEALSTPGLEGGFWFAWFNRVRDLPEALIAGREDILLTHLYRQMAYDPSVLDAEAMTEYVRAFGAGGLRGSLGVYRDILVTSAQNRESATTKLTIPVLAIGGRMGMGEMVAQDMREVAEQVQGEVFEECGHFVAEERPEQLAERLLRFWGEQG